MPTGLICTEMPLLPLPASRALEGQGCDGIKMLSSAKVELDANTNHSRIHVDNPVNILMESATQRMPRFT